MFGLGTTELIIIGVIIFLIFGAKRIPEIGKGLGGALKEFKKIKRDLSHEEISDDNEGVKGQKKNDPPSLENKLAEKVMEQVPGVKKAMDINEKVKKVKEVIK
jgi:sec-independent protein translocase protein TatA